MTLLGMTNYFKKVLSIGLLVTIAITNQSCISRFVLGNNKAKYTISANVPSPQVENTEDVKKKYKKTTTEGNSTSINVFRNNATSLKISKPGYQSRNVDIYPTNKRLENKLIDIIGGGIILRAVMVASSYNTEFADYGGILLLYGVFNIGTALIYPAPGPVGTYAGFEKPKMEIKLYPDSVSNPGKLEVICDEFTTPIKKGTVVGNVYTYKNKYGPVTLNDSLFSYLSEINNHLSKVNLLRSANTIEKSKSLFDKAIVPAYIIRGEVKSENIDYHNTSLISVGRNKINTVVSTKFSIEWKVYDKLERLLFTKTTEGWGQRLESNTALSDYDGVKTALNELVFSDDFSKYIKSYKEYLYNTPAEKFNTQLLLTKPKNQNKDSKFLSEASKSVVTIIRKESHGSGTIISPDGYILTNAHVCGNDTVLKIRFKNGDETQAKIVRMNVEEDLALLKFDNVNQIEGLAINTSKDEVAIADEIYVIGTPADLTLGQSMSRGLISGIRVIRNKKLYQTDAAINGGNSGGAMLDVNGFLIGIPSSKVKGKGLEGLGFAIPTGIAVEFLKLGYKQ